MPALPMSPPLGTLTKLKIPVPTRASRKVIKITSGRPFAGDSAIVRAGRTRHQRRQLEMRYLKAFGLIVLTAVLWNSGASAQNAPTGSYLQSCRDASTNGSTLYANCRNSYGEWQSVTLPDYQRCRGDIGNDNGTLRCDMRGNDYQPPPQNGAPTGSHLPNCHDPTHAEANLAPH